MKLCKDVSKNSGILAYEISNDFIKIKFKDGEVYTYNYKKPGKPAIKEMKKKAVQGEGLATYINKFVRDDYWKKK